MEKNMNEKGTEKDSMEMTGIAPEITIDIEQLNDRMRIINAKMKQLDEIGFSEDGTYLERLKEEASWIEELQEEWAEHAGPEERKAHPAVKNYFLGKGSEL